MSLIHVLASFSFLMYLNILPLSLLLFILCTELPKYYARLQTAVAHGLGLPAGRLAGRQTDAAPKHSLLFQFSFRVDGHAHRHTFAKRRR